MGITRAAAHEAGHAVAAQWAGLEVLCAKVGQCGEGSYVRTQAPDGFTDDLQQAAFTSAIYSAAGLAGERLFGLEPDEVGGASDLAQLRQTYDEHHHEWRWARHFEIFKTVMLEVAEQALRADEAAWRAVANRLMAFDAVDQRDITVTGPFSPWLRPGKAWRPVFSELMGQASARLAEETEALQAFHQHRQAQRAFARRHEQLTAQIAARRPEAPRAYQPPRVGEIMRAWGR
jgi:hypothetical protein